jgi:hypothetical protein
MSEDQKTNRIKCPILLSAFKVNDSKSKKTCQFDFSIINLFDEFRMPSVPYFAKKVDYEKIDKMISELNKNIDNTD